MNTTSYTIDEASRVPEVAGIGTFSDADLGLLSEEEQAAIAEAQAAELAETTPPVVEETPAPAPVAEVTPPAPVAPPVVLPEVPDVTLAKATLEGADAAKKAAWDKWNDMDLDYTEEQLQTDLAKIEAEVLAAQKDVAKAEVLAEQRTTIETTTQEAAAKAWFDQVGSYMDQFPDLKTGAAWNAFNDQLLKITANPAYESMTDADVIVMAHRRAQTELADIGTTIAPPKPKAAAAPKPGPRTDDRPEPAPSLANLPTTDIGGGDDSRFAAVEAMLDNANDQNSIWAAEDAWASLPAATRAALLAEV